MTGEPGVWINIGQIHTLPADELELHALAPTCACMPTVSQEDDGGRVLGIVHNSYDAREVNEPAEVLKLIPKKKGESDAS